MCIIRPLIGSVHLSSTKLYISTKRARTAQHGTAHHDTSRHITALHVSTAWHAYTHTRPGDPRGHPAGPACRPTVHGLRPSFRRFPPAATVKQSNASRLKRGCIRTPLRGWAGLWLLCPVARAKRSPLPPSLAVIVLLIDRVEETPSKNCPTRLHRGHVSYVRTCSTWEKVFVRFRFKSWDSDPISRSRTNLEIQNQSWDPEPILRSGTNLEIQERANVSMWEIFPWI